MISPCHYHLNRAYLDNSPTFCITLCLSYFFIIRFCTFIANHFPNVCVWNLYTWIYSTKYIYTKIYQQYLFIFIVLIDYLGWCLYLFTASYNFSILIAFYFVFRKEKIRFFCWSCSKKYVLGFPRKHPWQAQ